MIEPSDIIKRTITIDGSQSDQSNKIVQTNIRFGKRTVTLLTGLDLLLRFEYKKQKYSRGLKLIKDQILRDEKIFNPEKHFIIQKILLLDREIRETINKDKKELNRREKSEFEDFVENLKRREENLKKITKKNKLHIIKPQKDYYCECCNGFRSGPDLVPTSIPVCNICQNKLTKMNISRIDNDIVSYLTGYWFEDYIANMLNSYGWKAWSSPTLTVYGVSGAPHQIDVLAIKNGRVLVVECKTGEFIPTQVRNFLGKYYDTRCHKALAIAIGSIHPDGIKIIEKNPAIDYYDNIKSYKKLIKKISSI